MLTSPLTVIPGLCDLLHRSISRAWHCAHYSHFEPDYWCVLTGPGYLAEICQCAWRLANSNRPRASFRLEKDTVATQIITIAIPRNSKL
eukprot:707385-Amphidinium_carterae.1